MPKVDDIANAIGKKLGHVMENGMKGYECLAKGVNVPLTNVKIVLSIPFY